MNGTGSNPVCGIDNFCLEIPPLTTQKFVLVYRALMDWRLLFQSQTLFHIYIVNDPQEWVTILYDRVFSPVWGCKRHTISWPEITLYARVQIIKLGEIPRSLFLLGRQKNYVVLGLKAKTTFPCSRVDLSLTFINNSAKTVSKDSVRS